MGNSAYRLASQFHPLPRTSDTQLYSEPWVLAGSRLDPNSLKTMTLLDTSALPWRNLYDRPGWWRRFAAYGRRLLLNRGMLATPAPVIQSPHNQPVGPFLCSPAGHYLFGSTTVGLWLTNLAPPAFRQPLVPKDPAARLLCLLIDEAADEWLGCLAFHQRWAVSEPDILQILSAEWPRLPQPLARFLACRIRRHRKRQLPFRLSVSPRCQPALATRGLLEGALDTWLHAMDTALGGHQPWLLGQRFSLADAGCYGQLAACAQSAVFADQLAARLPGNRTLEPAGATRGGRRALCHRPGRRAEPGAIAATPGGNLQYLRAPDAAKHGGVALVPAGR